MLAETRVTLGAGGWSIQAPLLIHIFGGLVAIVTGYVALLVVKGGGVHRRAGSFFVYAMLLMGIVGGAIAAYERKPGSVNAGVLVTYYVVTALLAVRPPTALTRRVETSGMVVAFGSGLWGLTVGTLLVMQGMWVSHGVPVPMIFFMATVTLWAAAGDVRMLRAGGWRGSQRVARHLWRMCFSLFIAAGSFFLGQAQVMPKSLRIYPVLTALSVLPLVLMFYWLWRVRVRNKLRGMILVGAAQPAS
jgi:hypothetical protein